MKLEAKCAAVVKELSSRWEEPMGMGTCSFEFGVAGEVDFFV